MLTTPFFIGLAVLFAGLLGSRFLVERATKLLSAEEKVKLIDSFSRLRTFGALPMLPIAFLFFGVVHVPYEWRWPVTFAAFGLFVVYFVVINLMVSRKFSELGINASYRAAYNRARIVSCSGWVAFFIVVTLGPFLSR
jgi:hypothetical protein